MFPEIFLISFLVLAAVFVGTLSGFGASTIMVPVMALFFPLPIALFFVAIIHWFNDIWKMLLFKSGLRWRIILGFGATGVVASYLGASLSFRIPEDVLLRALGVFLLLYVAFIVKNPEWKLPEKRATAITGGFFYGLIAGAFGAGGAVRSAFLAAYNLPKAAYIFTSGAIGIMIDTTRIGAYFAGGTRLEESLLWGMAAFIPISLLGALIAQKTVARIPEKYFRLVVALFLALVAIKLIAVPVSAVNAAKPEDFGLREGDLISAIDDPDIYIVNEHGYKRLFLNPAIFGFYGHLKWENVKEVPPQTRDAFGTSGYFRNCEANDPKVYATEVTAEDAGAFHWLNMTGDKASLEEANFPQKVFCINNSEYAWYPKSTHYTSTAQVPKYDRKSLNLPLAPKAVCQDECSSGDGPRCLSQGVMQECNYYDEDPCFEWGEPITCMAGEPCAGGSCGGRGCSDGTSWGQCSKTKPQYCSGGNLIDFSSICGCPAGLVPYKEKCIEPPMDEPLRTAVVRDLPFADTLHCFQSTNRKNPECKPYYKEEVCKDYGNLPPPPGSSCTADLVCSLISNPVCGANGLSYLNACWAETLGTTVASYGYCPQMKSFMSDLWLTRNVMFGESILASSPQIGFVPDGSSSRGVPIPGTWFTSKLYDTTGSEWTLQFDIEKEVYGQKKKMTVQTYGPNKPKTALGEIAKTLLVYLPYEEYYPEQVLLDWTGQYVNFLNAYYKKMQKANPVQYNVTPVVVDPPSGVTILTLFDSAEPGEFLEDNKKKVYDAAIAKLGLLGAKDFKVFMIVPIINTATKVPDGPPGGDSLMSYPVPMEVPYWFIKRDKAYSTYDKEVGLGALLDFQQMFNIMSHELIHGLGWEGTHVPLDKIGRAHV